MGRAFETTRWSLILAAGEQSGPALSELCRIYWQPVNAFYRSRCRDSELARDLTQSFFTQLLEKQTLAAADPSRGRFRSFLLSAARNFWLNELERQSSQKRGARAHHADLDGLTGFEEPSDAVTPEEIFNRQWALTLLQRVMDTFLERLSPLQRERFQAMKGALMGIAPAPSYAELAQELGMSETAVKVSAHRFRKLFGQCLQEEVAQTVDNPELIQDEIRYLVQAFAASH